MTNAVVVSDEITILTSVPNTTTIVTGQLGPRGRAAAIANVEDVDLSNLQSGSILVYNPTISKWVSTVSLNQQNIDCGEF